MPISIEISSGSGTPIYTQIVEQISQAIARARLTPGEKLPAVRKLADDLVVNPNTVAKAFQQLEQRGLVTTRVGSGTFVAESRVHFADRAQMKAVIDRMDHLIGECIHFGLNGTAIQTLFEDRLNEFKGPKEGDRHE